MKKDGGEFLPGHANRRRRRKMKAEGSVLIIKGHGGVDAGQHTGLQL